MKKGRWSLGLEEESRLKSLRKQDLYCGVEIWVQGGVVDWGSAHGGCLGSLFYRGVEIAQVQVFQGT